MSNKLKKELKEKELKYSIDKDLAGFFDSLQDSVDKIKYGLAGSKTSGGKWYSKEQYKAIAERPEESLKQIKKAFMDDVRKKAEKVKPQSYDKLMLIFGGLDVSLSDEGEVCLDVKYALEPLLYGAKRI